MGETDVDRPNGASGSDGFWDASRCVGTPQCPPRCPRFVSKDGRGLVVRPYDDADRDALAEMYRDYDPDARSMGLPPTDEAHIAEWLSNLVDRGRNFVAVADRGIVGHAAYVASDDPEPELAVFVHQDSHDRGIGTELCRHVVADAADAGREALVLHVAPDNQRAVHVYRELGFETVNSDGADTKMRLDLTPPVPPAARPTTGTESRG
ncbi:HAT (histone acetyltransferase) family protein [Haloferax volcanii DSM 14919]|uniref:HAT (Histone acetyltransferase) family protein n=1 Tax=Haloferax lucentense (strain DSM 14919 / JCM 9276 / NCIMB 13854 / Aa 2.2) TaxID=1230452 RepID=M0GTT5_HALL2|nr:GNAT family N-acetyltransferase [Haloferax lucentense]ELZ74947.1 HAT (histone acetyltransferase) family protein [Haloferax lucentense DSM 14919]